MGYYKTRIRHLSDMPPIIDPLPKPERSGYAMIPAVVAVLPGRVLALHPAEGASDEEKRIISRISLSQFLKVLPDAIQDLCIDGAVPN